MIWRKCVVLLMLTYVVQALGRNESALCGHVQGILENCFEDLSPELKEFLVRTKIPANEKDITSKCIVFRKGLDCFDEYTKKCLYTGKIQLYRNTIFGAKNFLNKLCYDSRFQADYLRHKECFVYIQDDWKKCTRDFQVIISDELHNSSKQNVSSTYMQFCCSRYAYENCVYNSAKFKCESNSAKYVKMVSRLLSDERQFRYCRQYEDLLCSAGWNLFSKVLVVALGMIFSHTASLYLSFIW